MGKKPEPRDQFCICNMKRGKIRDNAKVVRWLFWIQ